jgi:hypothetical protein
MEDFEKTHTKEFIWSYIKDLPTESLNEIISFIVYVRKKTLQPELFKSDYNLLATELSEKDNFETKHLLEEFDNYKTKYPHE